MRKTMLFNDLIVGPSNWRAVDLARRVAHDPGDGCANPLVIVGDNGTGKTAILEAMMAEIGSIHPDKKVVLWTARQYLDNWISALQDRRVQEFRQELNQVDVLLLDEFEFFHDSRFLREELRHLFTDRLNAGRQIVVATTERIAEITDPEFDKGLKGRLLSGVEVELGLLDESMCRAFVQKILYATGVAHEEPISLEGVHDFWTLSGSVCRWMAFKANSGIESPASSTAEVCIHR